jgi:hypothetical protein
MKRACAIGPLFVFGIVLPLVASSGSEPNELDIPLVPQRGQKIRGAMLVERSKIVSSSLKVPALQEESRTEKRSTQLAEPQDTLRGLKGVMVFIEDIDTDVEKSWANQGPFKKKGRIKATPGRHSRAYAGRSFRHTGQALSLFKPDHS